MPVPTSRSTTYSGGSPVKSSDLNDLQDCIIGRKHGSIVRSFIPRLWAAGGWTTHDSGLTGPYYLESGSGVSGTIIIDTTVGDRIAALRASVSSNGSVTPDCLFKLQVISPTTQNPTQIGTVTDLARVAGWSNLDLVVTSHVMLDGEVLMLALDPSAAGYFVGNCRLTFDHP